MVAGVTFPLVILGSEQSLSGNIGYLLSVGVNGDILSYCIDFPGLFSMINTYRIIIILNIIKGTLL